MKQLEIEFFWPLTEQTNLDLDFTPCINFIEEKRILEQKNATYFPNMYGGTLLTTSSTGNITNSFEFRPSNKSVGYYKLGNSNFHIHLEHKPNIITRWVMKYVFNFIWKDNA